jgi:hypothetical protein
MAKDMESIQVISLQQCWELLKWGIIMEVITVYLKQSIMRTPLTIVDLRLVFSERSTLL